MAVKRRVALKVLAGAAATATSATGTAAAREARKAPADAVGMLYDTTLCIGCKACVVACAEANDMKPDRSGLPDDLYQAPVALNEHTKNVIKLYSEGKQRSYMKAQCMHCVDPACVGACMIGSLQKREYGIVTWDPGRCIGCRYCGVACPFTVPKFEWESINPKIVKCELCNHRFKDDKGPACCEVCPREAVIFGKYDDLLAEAKKRLKENPDRYVPHIYGEKDGGGTQVLYLSHVPFEKLGLPELGENSVPDIPRTLQHGIYQGFVAPAALYAVLGAVMFRNRRRAKAEGEDTP